MTQPTFDLAGRVALVTGGTRGIGRALAEGLAAAGAEVIVHGKDPRPPAGLDWPYVGADLSTPDGAQQVKGQLGLERLDVLVNNAGYEVEEDSLAVSPVEWARTLSVNLLSPVLLVGVLAPQLTASKHASVINITSIHQQVPYPRHLAYSVSKAGLAMATKTLALDLAHLGIRVNAIAPGVIETDINRATIERVGREQFERVVPLGRTGQPHDVAGAAVFLASDASSYMTGETLFVDGGYTHHLVRYEGTRTSGTDEQHDPRS